MSNKILTRVLIVAGILIIVFFVGYELINSWSAVNSGDLSEVDLPDPPPPAFNYTEWTPPPGREESLFLPKFGLPDDLATQQPSHNITRLSTDESEDLEPEEDPLVIMGIIKIPRISLSEYLLEGMENEQLYYGVGHKIGSPFPGEEGNVVVAAHRSSSTHQPFRYLDKVKIDDFVIINFWYKTYYYQVYEIFVVSKYDYWVMLDVEEEPYCLTMITCDPLIYAGNRPNRMIVRARLMYIEDTVQEGEEGDAEDNAEEEGVQT